MVSFYLQGRVVVQNPDAAAQMVRQKLAGQGYRIERLTVQPFKEVWIEWVARVENAKK